MANVHRMIRTLAPLTRRLTTQAAVSTKEVLHTPVMADEVLEALDPRNGQVFVDMTFGAGGHCRRILEAAPGIKVFALDRDPLAHSLATDLAAEFPGQVIPLLGRFSELPGLLQAHGVPQRSLDGVLLDLGCSSMQMDTPGRGFALSRDGPLDMRMDGSRFPDEPTAADVLSRIDETDLAAVLKTYGEEKQAKKIARAVVEARYTFRRLETTGDLAALVAAACDGDQRQDKLQRPAHSATKTFQALRIFVNNEVNELNYAMIVAHAYLKLGGRIATLSFHSLEDRIVKRHLHGNVISNAANPLPLKYSDHSVVCEDRDSLGRMLESGWHSLHKHVAVPTAEEVDRNPRSRSAKLRAALKVGEPRFAAL